MDPKVELELVKLARQGDKNAFGLLIERYRGMAVSMVNHESVARELVQEAMLQAYLSLAQRHQKVKALLFGGGS